MVMSASMTIYCNSTNRLSLGFFLRELFPVFKIAACKNFLHEGPRPSCSETDTLLWRSLLTFLYLVVHSANYQTDQNKLLTIVLIIEKQSHENLPELLVFMFWMIVNYSEPAIKEFMQTGNNVFRWYKRNCCGNTC